MLDNQPPVPADPQSGFLTPKLEPGQSPPPYPGPAPELAPLVTPGHTDTTDFGPEQMEEDEGRSIGVLSHFIGCKLDSVTLCQDYDEHNDLMMVLKSNLF